MYLENLIDLSCKFEKDGKNFWWIELFNLRENLIFLWLSEQVHGKSAIFEDFKIKKNKNLDFMIAAYLERREVRKETEKLHMNL